MPGPDPLSDAPDAAADSLDGRKAALRRAARTARKRAHAAAADAGRAVAAAALDRLQGWVRERGPAARPPIAAGYQPMGSEIDPLPLMLGLADKGWELALPVVVGAGQPLIFRAWRPGQRLEPGAMGILQPEAAAVQRTPDVILAPLLAFDRSGRRLGQGGGFYDRTVAAIRAGGAPCLFVGLAYDAQRRGDLVSGPFDQPLDGIVTEAGCEGFAGAGSRP